MSRTTDVKLAIVHVGHRWPDMWVRSILALLLSMDDFEGKQYYVGFNSADEDTTQRVERVLTILDEHFPGLIVSRHFTQHPGLLGYPASNYKIIGEFEHDYWLQLGSDIFAVTPHIDDVLLQAYKEARQNYGTAYIGPVANISEICSPYFLAKCFPATNMARHTTAMDPLRPTATPIWQAANQVRVWQSTEDLDEQAKVLAGPLVFPNPLPFEYSCGMIVVHKDVVRDAGENWLRRGEERTLFERHNGRKYGFGLHQGAYVAHLAYHPAFEAVVSSGAANHAFRLVDRVIQRRIAESGKRETWESILRLIAPVLDVAIGEFA